jgi:hypothetical protein
MPKAAATICNHKWVLYRTLIAPAGPAYDVDEQHCIHCGMIRKGDDMSDTKKNDAPSCHTEFVASWNDWEGAVCVNLEDYEKLERALSAERKRADDAEADARRWEAAFDRVTAYMSGRR